MTLTDLAALGRRLLRSPVAFSVVGRLEFPVQMLALDECFPATPEDGLLIDRMARGLVDGLGYTSVQLKAFWPLGRRPSADQWQALGWSATKAVRS